MKAKNIKQGDVLTGPGVMLNIMSVNKNKKTAYVINSITAFSFEVPLDSIKHLEKR